MSSNEVTPWPGTRGAFVGRRRGVISLHDDRFPGYDHVVHNYRMSLVRISSRYPADRARDYYDGYWVGSAALHRATAMRAQWMNIQLGPSPARTSALSSAKEVHTAFARRPTATTTSIRDEEENDPAQRRD
ncbi:hypothetical protein M409DRAFT_54675 [Zasmidium cellare ATCC 36951]|uniref:Uncharacterized protein n=1 Tax=Zasmidium cellare ATCC 36951 TaxID=1080233 RepID=A0A6A6CID1_ZASCE|nr:uncharacterized protein M409DRAFT_54675 [Zasmidium cellare ATCC 36951]KAF2166905.1 hypothetical protein M409DRAFT_54675 [Zasmidium cellare ATCC 36951]